MSNCSFKCEALLLFSVLCVKWISWRCQLGLWDIVRVFSTFFWRLRLNYLMKKNKSTKSKIKASLRGRPTPDYTNILCCFSPDFAFCFCSGVNVVERKYIWEHFIKLKHSDEQFWMYCTGPAALACLLNAVGLFRVATGDGQPTPCIAASLLWWVLGVLGQDWEGSWSPADVGVRVEEVEDDEGEEERVTSPASFRGCSCRMDSWKKERKRERSRLSLDSRFPAWP